MRRILLAAAAALALAPAATPAHAGSYDVWACKDANGRSVGNGGWARDVTTHNALYGSTCGTSATPGALSISQNTSETFVRNTQFALGFRPPEGQSIAAWQVTYDESTPFEASQQWSEDFTVFVNEPNFADEQNIADRCWGSNGCRSRSGYTSSGGATTGGVWLFTNCNGSGRPSDCPGSAGGAIALEQAKVTLTDSADPAFPGQPSGPLVAGGTVSGVAAASFSAADQGGGVARVVAEVDGRELGATDFANSGACVVPYSTVKPCQSQAAGQVAVDTRRLADGPHQLRLLAVDAGGNAAAFGPVTLRVSNGPKACAPTSDPKVRARFAGSKTKRTVAYGRGATVGGTVKRADGTPVGGAAVTVSAGRSRYATVAAATTGPKGRWSAKVPAGQSRKVYALVRQGDAAPACSGTLRLATRAGVTFKAVHKHVGRVARFTGRVKGARAGRANVVLQGYEPSTRRWTTTGSARVDRKGRVSARYVFRGGGTFSFRLRVRAASGYPYAAGTSKRVRVSAG